MVKPIVLMAPLASIPWMESSSSVSVHPALLVMEESVEQTVQQTYVQRLPIVLKLPPVSTLLMMDLSVFAALDTKGMAGSVVVVALVCSTECCMATQCHVHWVHDRLMKRVSCAVLEVKLN